MPSIPRTASGTPYVRHRGATIHLLRRNGGRRASVYSVRFRIRGREFLRSTGCTELAAATAAGRALYDALADGRQAAADAAAWRRTVGTVGDVLAWYEAHATVREATMRDNARRLLRFVREAVPGGATDPRTVSLAALTRGRLDAWIARRQGIDSPDRRTIRPENAGIASDLRGIRSVFSGRQRADLAAAVPLPEELGAFLATPGVRIRADRFRALDPARLAEMDAAACSLQRTNPALCTAYWILRLLGLRTSEAIAARRHWIEPTPDGHALVIEDRPGEFQVKNGVRRVLPLPPELAPTLLAARDRLIDPGDGSSADKLVRRELAAFIRQYFPDGTKSTYLLRKQRASEWLRDTSDIATVAYRLGDKIATVEAHYIDVIASAKDARADAS